MNPDADVRIVIDGTKLSHKYKIEPFIYSSMYNDNSYTAPVFKFEAEERIVFFPNLPQRATIKLISELKNISNYIIRIDAVKKRSSDYANIENQFIELSKEYPYINFNIIDNLNTKFKEPIQ